MFGSRFNAAKCETLSRLCVARIKLMRNKKHQQLKIMRKDIAELLRTGKQEYARIRVEAVVRENQILQAYELLELFLEFLAVRAPLIGKSKEIPRDLIESVSSVIYAAQRVPDLPEIVQIRALLASKYGKEYAAEASSDYNCDKWQVHEKLKECLTIEAPAGDVKLEVLTEIAQEYSVDWDAAAAARDLLPQVMPAYASVQQSTPPLPPIYQHPVNHPQLQVQRPAMSIPDPRQTAGKALEAARNAQHAAEIAIQNQRQQQTPQQQRFMHTTPGSDAPVVSIPPPAGWLETTGQPYEASSCPSPITTPSHAPPTPFSSQLPISATTAADIQGADDGEASPPAKANPFAPPHAPNPSPLDPPSLPQPPQVTFKSGELDELQKHFLSASKSDELDELQKRFLALKNL